MSEEQPMRPPNGSICWAELATGDAAAAKKFYSTLFGWAMKESSVPGMDYTEFSQDGRPIGGIMQITAEMGPMPTAWTSYVAVDNVDEAAAQAKELGGQLVVPLMDIPHVGRFCVIADPTGGTIAMITLGGSAPA